MICPRRLLPALFALGTALALLPGCRKALTPVERGDRDQILEIGNLTEPTDLDPQLVTSVQDFKIILALNEGLVWLDPDDLRPVPGVAASWDVSPDATVYTFHLRPEARWSDGTPLTAEDFLYSFRRMLTPALAAEYAYMLADMVGAEDYQAGRLTDFSKVGCKALDPHTLQITLRYPTPYFLGLVAHHSWFPVPRGCIEKYGKLEDRNTVWTRPGNHIGNGPFNLAEWRTGQVVRAVKNPRYWDAANVRLRGINFWPIENADTEERAFRAGKFHVTSVVPLEKLDRYRREQPELLNISPYLSTYFYRFNTQRPPMNDVRVRRALALGFNRQEVAEHVLRAGQKPAFSYVPPGLPGYVPAPFFREDIAEARRLLAEAGYPEGRGFPPLQIIYNTSEAHQRIAVALQAMWQRNLGIGVTLQNMEAKVLQATTRAGDYQISRYAWTGDYPDPNTFMTLMISTGGNNQTGWANPEYDRLVAQAAVTTEPATRADVFRRAETLLMQEMPIMPIYFYVHPCLQRPSLRQWPNNLLDYHSYQRVYLENSKAK